MAQARNAAGRERRSHGRSPKASLTKNLITRWQAGQLLAGRSSFYLGKYRLIELLGRGGMGSVFLGQHVTMNRRVALKIISRQVGKDPRSLDRFLAEARAIAALDHPNIVQAYSVDNEGDRYYLVMEYVEGIDLQRLVEEDGPLDCDRAADYIGQAADGLDHAHQRNMIHGDIKPSNLLVNAQGVVKILDLGLARLAADAPAECRRGPAGVGFVGSSGLRPGDDDPELARWADLSALGHTLYFLLTGQPPDSRVPPDVGRLRPDVPPALAAICGKMMAEKPGDGYPTAAAVSLVLTQWQASMPRLKRATPLPMANPRDEP